MIDLAVGEFMPITPFLHRNNPITALIYGPFAIHEPLSMHIYSNEGRGISIAKSGIGLCTVRSQKEAAALVQILLELQPDVKKWESIPARLDKNNPWRCVMPKWLSELYEPSYTALRQWRATQEATR